MNDNGFVNACTLRTFGIDQEDFERLCGDLSSVDIDIQFAERNLDGKIFISKSSVDAIALENILSKINVRLEEYLYSDIDRSLNECLVVALAREGEMVAVAESITGGLLSSALCDIKGASAVFYEGIVTYNSSAKLRRLHVPATMLEEYTAVSEQACEAMLKGVLTNKEVKYAMATTGYASHTDKALRGIAYIGYGTIGNYRIEAVKYGGNRNEVRAKVVNHIIFRLLKTLEGNARKY